MVLCNSMKRSIIESAMDARYHEVYCGLIVNGPSPAQMFEYLVPSWLHSSGRLQTWDIYGRYGGVKSD